MFKYKSSYLLSKSFHYKLPCNFWWRYWGWLYSATTAWFFSIECCNFLTISQQWLFYYEFDLWNINSGDIMPTSTPGSNLSKTIFLVRLFAKYFGRALSLSLTINSNYSSRHKFTWKACLFTICLHNYWIFNVQSEPVS